MDKISYLEPVGRPCNGLAGRKNHSAVFSIRHRQQNGDVIFVKTMESQTGLHIMHDTIHRILIDKDLASRQHR